MHSLQQTYFNGGTVIRTTSSDSSVAFHEDRSENFIILSYRIVDAEIIVVILIKRKYVYVVVSYLYMNMYFTVGIFDDYKGIKYFN